MTTKNSLGLMGGALVLSLGATLAFAALSGDDAIKARQACMKANGAGMGVLVPIIKGEKPYDAAIVKAATDKMGSACDKWTEFWPADSMTSKTLKSRALENVWKDPKDFEGKGNTYYTAFTALAATEDEASFKAAFPAVGQACGACHEKNRAPAP